MTDSEREPHSIHELSDVEHIRARPAMYLGGTDFFGFVQYLVSAFDIMLDHGATWIEFEIAEIFRLSSDAVIPTRVNEAGALEPFEAFGELKPRHIPDAIILMALSYGFRATIRDGHTETEFVTSTGRRELLQQRPANTSEHGITLEFDPDFGVFRNRSISNGCT